MLKKITIIGFLIMTLICSGCNLLPKRETRPAPVRPRQEMRKPVVSKVTKKDLQDRLTKIKDYVKKDDWTAANKEVNSLGGEMLRHYPVSGKGKSLREMAKFDADYAKLKVSVKTHKKDSALGDITKLREALDRTR